MVCGAKSLEQAIEIQSQLAKRAYENYAEASKLGEWYVNIVRDASKPFEQVFASKRPKAS
jgi:hypothetical protein